MCIYRLTVSLNSGLSLSPCKWFRNQRLTAACHFPVHSLHTKRGRLVISSSHRALLNPVRVAVSLMRNEKKKKRKNTNCEQFTLGLPDSLNPASPARVLRHHHTSKLSVVRPLRDDLGTVCCVVNVFRVHTKV